MVVFTNFCLWAKIDCLQKKKENFNLSNGYLCKLPQIQVGADKNGYDTVDTDCEFNYLSGQHIYLPYLWGSIFPYQIPGYPIGYQGSRNGRVYSGADSFGGGGRRATQDNLGGRR